MAKLRKNIVLLVEDEKAMSRALERFFSVSKPKFTLLKTDNLADAETLFNDNRSGITSIMMDGELKGTSAADSVAFVKKIREQSKWSGVIFAISGNPEIQERLMGAGCTHQVAKEGLLAFINQLLSGI